MARKWSFWTLPALVLDPIDGFDLKDNKGDADHSKIVPFLVILATFVFHAVGNPMPLWHVITLVSAAFGYGSWRTFLKSKTTTLTSTTENTLSTTVNHTITETRDPVRGIDPAP